MKIQIQMQVEKETKGTIKYQEVRKDSERGHTFYLLKSALTNGQHPNSITLTIESN